MSAAIPGYIKASAELIPRFEAISSEELYAHVNHLLPQGNKSILDIGAGTGVFLDELKSAGFNSLIGIEPSLEPINAAPSHRKKWLKHDIFRAGQFDKNSFDFILM